MNPIAVRKEKAGEVLLLIRRINEANTKKDVKKEQFAGYDSKGRMIIRRRAGDDSWY